MSNQNFAQENHHNIKPKPEQKPAEQADIPASETPTQKVQRIQRQVGNRAVQRMLSQRSGGDAGGFEVDDDTEQRINSARGGGQPLDVGVQQHMQDAMGYDFTGVRVHTSSDAANLSQNLQAKAFTTGSDIFFNQGAYQPQSSAGKELIAHELTHVVQQGSGQVDGGESGMKVNAPNDVYEQQADAAARQAMSAAPTGQTAPVAQRQEIPEEEELAQAKPLDAVQREGLEEEELAQTRPLDALQRDALQREIPEEEEMAQTSALQRQEMDEDEMEL